MATICVLLAIVLEPQIDGVGRVHQDEVDLPVASIDLLAALQVMHQVGGGQAIGIDRRQRRQPGADLGDVAAIEFVPMVDAVLDQLVEFLGAARHLLLVVDQREAEIDSPLVDFDVGSLGRRQAGLLGCHVIAPGMMLLDRGHAEGRHGERLMQIVTEPEDALVMAGPQRPQRTDASVDHGSLAVLSAGRDP